jgi:hypothetical protein
VFATHDISEKPSRFGCTPSLFESVVGWAADSGSKILPVVEALKEVAGSSDDPCADRDPGMALFVNRAH